MANTFQLIELQDSQSQQYNIDLPCYAYIRFSTMGQVKNSKQSKVQQDTRMHEKLIRVGFKDIRKKDKDEGISAQKGTDERLDLADIYAAMARGECGAIAAWDAARIWRDRDRVYYNDFIKQIKKYNVPIILHDRTYWPRIDADMEALRLEFEYSQKALEQMYKKANPARQEAILSGCYGGHCVPMGYIVVGEKGERKYEIYEPHAKLIRWIFKRYEQLNGNLGRLGRELVEKSFHFPNFDKDELRRLGADVPHVALTHDENGYKLQTRAGLLSILTNRAYLGWYVYEAKSEESRVFKGEYINKDSHSAIVELDSFLYSYERLSSTTLDGLPNENKPKVVRQKSEVNALMDGCLTSSGVPMYAMRKGDYVARLDNDGWKAAELVVDIKQVDATFSCALIAVLKKLELMKDSQASAKLAEKLNALKAEQEGKAETLEEQLANIDKAIRQWELVKSVAMEEESPSDVAEAIRHLKRLRGNREAVENKANYAAKEANELAECEMLLERAICDWQGLGFNDQQRFVRLIVGKADIVECAPHVLKLSVYLPEPVNRSFTLYLYRQRGSKEAWTDKENAAIRRLYPCTDRATILEKLPTRTWQAIIMQAGILKVERATRVNTSGIADNVAYADVQLVQSLGLSPNPLVSLALPFWTIDADTQINGNGELISINRGISRNLAYIIRELRSILRIA